MNRLLKYVMMAMAAVFTLGSCNEFEMLEKATGYLSVSLQKDDEVHSKALVAPAPDQVFSLTILDDKGNQVADVPDHRTLEVDPITLVAGLYHVDAVSGANMSAAWDSPFYAGQTSVKVMADKNNHAEIICSLANVMVTAEFSSDYGKYFEEYTLTVDNGEEALVFSNLTGTLDRTGYFRVTGVLNWRLYIKNTDGAYFEKSGSYTGVEAQEHYKLKFQVKDEADDQTGAAAFKIVIDDSINPAVEYPLTLNFGVSTYPAIAPNEGFDVSGDTPYPYGDASVKKLTVTAASGMSSLRVLKPSSFEYELVQASPSVVPDLKNLGIEAESVDYGATTTVIDITSYVKNHPVGSSHLAVMVYDIKGHMTRLDVYVNIISDVQADVVSVVPAPTSAVITARWFDATRPAGLGLEYKKASEASWTKVAQSAITFDDSAKTFSAEITGLEINTAYEFRPYTDKDKELRSMSFTTLAGYAAPEAVASAPWAKFAVVSGNWDGPRPEGLTFEYRASGTSAWTAADPSTLVFNDAQNTFEGELWGLAPDTTYEFRAVSSESEGEVKTFKTESAGSVYNMNFDDWYKDGKVWYPYAQNGEHTWDSANKGAATFIGSSTTPAEGSDAVKGKAARMESKNAIIAFAAGNLYTGSFGKISGVGAQLDWGVPFTSRPLALKGYYKYSPKKIDKTGSGMSSYKGQMDRGQILVFLTDWTAPFKINTTKGEFVDFNADYIIAYGKLESDAQHDDYVEFTIPLEYRTLDKKPTYVVISACASYLGDYFTGGVGSTMYVDEFSFVYDPSELTETERNKVNYR